MNIFRLTGDLSHLLAIIILLRKIWKSRSCAGESNLLEISSSILTGYYIDFCGMLLCSFKFIVNLYDLVETSNKFVN